MTYQMFLFFILLYHAFWWKYRSVFFVLYFVFMNSLTHLLHSLFQPIWSSSGALKSLDKLLYTVISLCLQSSKNFKLFVQCMWDDSEYMNKMCTQCNRMLQIDIILSCLTVSVLSFMASKQTGTAQTRCLCFPFNSIQFPQLYSAFKTVYYTAQFKRSGDNKASSYFKQLQIGIDQGCPDSNHWKAAKYLKHLKHDAS